MRISVVTPTGNRALALELCARYVERQTVKPYEWIIIDDGIEPNNTLTDIARSAQVRAFHFPHIGTEHTLNKNIQFLIKEVKGDAVVFMEDDDWYSPKYLEAMSTLLATVDVAGEANAHYYHLPTRRYKEMGNAQHASLCQTAFNIDNSSRADFLDVCAQQDDSHIDIAWWQRVRNSPAYGYALSTTAHCIGIKGMPGRKGIGVGHEPPETWQTDNNLSVLRSWIGSDVEYYLQRH